MHTKNESYNQKPLHRGIETRKRDSKPCEHVCDFVMS